MVKKIRTGAFKQGPKQRNIKGKENKYRPGTYAYIKAQRTRDISKYTHKYNTKRVYLYNLMTDAEKLKAYQTERKRVVNKSRMYQRTLGINFRELIDEEFETWMIHGFGNKTLNIPTAKQFMETGSGKIHSVSIERLIEIQNEMDRIANQYKDNYGRESLTVDTKLINQLMKYIEMTAINIIAEGKQSENLIRYKQKGLETLLRRWLVEESDVNVKNVRYEQLRTEYKYIQELIDSYLRQSDESFKSERNRAKKGATFQTTVIKELYDIFEYEVDRFLKQNGIKGQAYTEFMANNY